MPGALAVTYLFSRECPSHEEGRRLLEEAADAAGVAVEVAPREVRSDEEARALAFPGSPTYLLGGRDPFPAETTHAYRSDACRAYALPGGRVGPLPHVDDLARALRSAAGAGEEVP